MGEIYGYELLFRSGQTIIFTRRFRHSGRHTIVENWLLHGFEGLMGPFPFFLNYLTGEALVKGLATLLPRNKTVLEITRNHRAKRRGRQRLRRRLRNGSATASPR